MQHEQPLPALYWLFPLVRFWRHFRTGLELQSRALSLGSLKHPAVEGANWQTRHARRPPEGNVVHAPSKTGNQILASLAPADFALLKPDLESVDLPLRRQLELRGRAIENIYFLDSGLGSMVVSAGANHNIEVGIIGKEGMTGLPVVLGAEHSAHETFIQTAGKGWRIPAEKLRAAMARSPDLHRSLLLYVQALVTQMAYTVLANGRYKIEERLARWLLMADDRADGRAIQLTHEFLALMLGARRASVTLALSELQKRKVLRVVRRSIAILNRPALEEAANGSYGVPEAEYRRLITG
jgi:CRP-like cAMP-binding protein